MFQRLTKHFQAAAMELRQFVEEQDTVMGERDFAGGRRIAAANHAGVADGVVRVAERARGQQRLVGLESPKGAVDSRGAEALGRRQGRHDRRQSSGQHRLAGAGAPDKKHVVTNYILTRHAH
jgi:hypothetical protein